MIVHCTLSFSWLQEQTGLWCSTQQRTSKSVKSISTRSFGDTVADRECSTCSRPAAFG